MDRPTMIIKISEYEWDLRSQGLTFAPELAEAIGWRIEEMPSPLTMDFLSERIYVEDYPNVRDVHLALLTGELTRYEITYRIRTKDGGFKWFQELCDQVTLDASNKPIIATGRLYDLTEWYATYFTDGDEWETSSEDALTHCLSRNAIIERLNAVVEHAERDVRFLTIARIAIPNFLEINREEGYATGDHVLKRVVDLIKEHMDDSMFLGRLDAASFLLIFPGMPNTLANNVCKKIENALMAYDYKTKGIPRFNYSIMEYLGESPTEILTHLGSSADYFTT